MACVFLVVVGCARHAAAQSTLGSINGTVKDPSGAAVAGAALTLRNLDENTTAAAQSSPQGFYEFLNLKPGLYSVTASKAGFAAATTPEIRLDARQAREADLTLAVAGTTQAITVSAPVPLVNTEDGTISDSKNFEEITRLPLNYRGSGNDSPLVAIITVPGVMEDRGQKLSLGGGLPAQVEVSVDGISVVNVGGLNIPGNLPDFRMTPSPEIIGEFKTTSVDNSAEFGQMGDISMVTRGGTNQLHGSAFWYLQNRALDARTWNSPFPKPPKVYNTFGGSLSGPVELPSIYHGRNRTFFFVDYEDNHLPSSQLDQLLVPSASMRTGNLDGVPGPAAVDPLNGQAFPDNQVPLTRISSVATALLSYYPLPNTPLHNNINYLHLSDMSSQTKGYDVRVDHLLNSKQHLYARLTQKWYSVLGDSEPLPADSANSRDYNFVVSHAYAPNAVLSNEARFGFTRTTYVAHFPLLATDVVSKLGLTGLDLANVAGLGEFPTFTLSGESFSSTYGSRPANFNSRIFQYADVLSWVHGGHTMKFGGEARRVGYHANQNGDDLGEYDFVDGAFSGNAFADLLLGLPADSYYNALGPDADESAVNAGFFAQDSWKISRRFTLNYGLRWELHTPFVDAHGNISGFDHQTGSLIVPDDSIPVSPTFLSAINACPVATTQPCTLVLKASQAGLPNSLRHTYYGDWDPRLGFAWQPWADGRTVIRGGFGRYTQSLLGGFADAPTGIATSDVRYYQNFTGPGVPPLFTFPAASPPLSNLGESSGLETFEAGMDPNFRDPYSFQWNFTVERQLPLSTVFRASYIGVQSVGMPVIVNYNQVPASTIPWSQSRVPFPLWGGLYSLEPIGFAHYQGMQLEASRRFRSDFFFQASYALAKNLGEAGAPLQGNFNTGGVFPTEYSGNANGSITDRFDTGYDRGNLPGSRRNTFLLTALYPLPFGKGRAFGSNWRGLMQGGLGGWELSTVTLIESGTYLTPTINSNRDQSNTGVGGARTVPARPDRIGNGNLPNEVNGRIWDLSAFAPVPAGAGRFGNSGAGILEGPGAIAIAGGLAKTFSVTERARLRIEATFTNLPNHPNFLPPFSNISAPARFGVLTSIQSAQNSGNRAGQLGARFDF